MNITAPSASPAPGTPPQLRDAARIVQQWPLVVLLTGTAVLDLWDITINSMGNAFYAGSAWAGSTNWKALLFGSLDPGNAITVDKPPLSQWVMGLSGQIFGFSSASMLIPEALMGVAAVGLLYGALRRVSGGGFTGRIVGLVGGSLLALTPVAAMMFRFNNPDAAMILFMTMSVYFLVRALEKASLRWLLGVGVAIGFAFLAKMGEGLICLPAIALVYLIAAPTTLLRRFRQLVASGLAMIVASGWYVLLTMVWPAASRPYLAGSTNNSFMDLVLGYNGLGRLIGQKQRGAAGVRTPNAVALQQWQERMGGRGGVSNFGGSTGITRLFNGEWGYEISFFLPAALLASVLVLVSRGRAPRTDLMRAGALLFGLWMLIGEVMLSFAKGAQHPYYTLSIAPAIAGVSALGLIEMWRRRDSMLGRVGTAGLTLAMGGWGYVLLVRNPTWFPELRWILLVLTIIGAAAALFRWSRTTGGSGRLARSRSR